MAKRLAALSIGFLLALALGEILARLLLPPPARVLVMADPGVGRRLAAERSEPRAMRAREEAPPGGPFVLETPTGLRLRAATEVVIERHWISERTVRLRTNSLGFRNPEIGTKSRPRVLFLGDSITLGEYLEEDETFVRLVERRAAEEGAPLETINAGVNLIGLEEELAILLETGLRTEPDVVVVDLYLNDAFPSPGVRIVPLPPLLDASWFLRHVAAAAARLGSDGSVGRDATLVRQNREAWGREIAARFPAGGGDPTRDVAAFHGLVQRAVSDWGSAWAEGAWARMIPVLEELRRQSALHGFALRIVVFPVRPQVEAAFVEDFPQQRLARAAHDLDVPVLDLLPLLRRAHRAGGEPLFYDQCHPTPHASRLVAGWLLDFLRAGR
ncbi:MAG TPA: hypothetical protein VKA21_17070 [Candidatus Binatia bacterium]|nr:hypothetical protein [Candidatus Binatia bacterium]